MTTNATISESVTLQAPVGNTTAAVRSSYGQILKSSALIGGSSALNIGVRIIRTKAMAMLLGPSGYGLAGLYMSVADITQNVAGMGINSSGVRQIAEAVGSGDQERVAKTVGVLRKTSVALGVLGALLLAVFSRQISIVTFGDATHTSGVALLAIAVFFASVYGGQNALLQGMRRIADFAKMGVLGAVAGTAMTIVLVYFFRYNGIVPGLVAVAVLGSVVSHWYSRKVNVVTPTLAFAEVRREAAVLLKLGFVFMSSGLMTMGVAYFTRVFLLRKSGFEATGLYQAAWVLGGLYVGFILQAMGADFYPRLTASIHDHPACNRLVNEQTRIGMLIAGPGLLATLAFAPIVIALFYSAKFAGAVEILRWVCLGAALQVVSWPMGYIVLAKGRRSVFFWSEAAWAVVSVGLSWSCVTLWGTTGAGIAFFGSYLFHAVFIYWVARKLTGFHWSHENRDTGIFILCCTLVVFGSGYVLPIFYATAIGIIAVLLAAVYSFRVLTTLIPWDEIPSPLRRVLVRLGTVPST